MSKYRANPKPVLGILPIAKVNQYTGNIQKYMEVAKGRLCQNQSISVLMPDKPLFEQEEIMRSLHEMQAKNADMILFAIGSWMYTSLVATAAHEATVPCMLYGLSDEIANGSLGVALQIKYVLEEMQVPFEFQYGKIDDPEKEAEILRALRAAYVKNDLFGRSIATIGGKCMMMYQTQVNEFSWKRTFGLEFPQYDHIQLLKEVEHVDEAEAERLTDAFVAKSRDVNWNLADGERINDDAILSQTKLYLAYKRMQSLYNIDMFATKCMPELVSKVYGYSYGACIATALLNDEGIVQACEGDVPAGVSMYILRQLADKPAMFADVSRLNLENGVMNFFNCGSGPVSMAGKEGFRLWPIPRLVPDEAVPEVYYSGESGGACIEFEFAPDEPITLLRLGGNDATLRFHAVSATTTSRQNNPGEEPQNLFPGGTRWPGCGVRLQDPDAFLRHATGHHYAIVYGDYTRELVCLARFYGIRCVLDR